MFTIDDVRNALGGCLKGEHPGQASEFTGVANDSRVAKPGELFVALTTEVQDGHDFIIDAVAHGATGVIFDDEEIQLPDHVWAFRVDDMKHAYLGPGDLLLVKASHGLALGAVVAELVG